MKTASDQLLEDMTYPNLAALLRSGGKMEIGEDLSVGAFARIYRGNLTIAVQSTYRDFPDVLEKMEAAAKDLLNRTGEHADQSSVR